MTGYYDRTPARHIDGTAVFQTPGDLAAEQAVADELAAAWHCELRQLAQLCPIDRYAVKAGRVAGLVEIKVRAHPRQRYPTVWLNLRKWLALQLAAAGLGCPAVFAVGFADGIWWTALGEVEPRRHTIGAVDGGRRPVALRGDSEPVIHVPVDLMHPLDRELW